MSELRLTKAWTPLTEAAIAELPAQLGVYEIGDEQGRVVKIGFAGGREPFGIRSALDAERSLAEGTQFRLELTHGYLTRWEELLMIHASDHGRLPPGNTDQKGSIGRLSVAGGPSEMGVH